MYILKCDIFYGNGGNMFFSYDCEDVREKSGFLRYMVKVMVWRM